MRREPTSSHEQLPDIRGRSRDDRYRTAPAPAAPGQGVDAVGYAGRMSTFALIGVRE